MTSACDDCKYHKSFFKVIIGKNTGKRFRTGSVCKAKLFRTKSTGCWYMCGDWKSNPYPTTRCRRCRRKNRTNPCFYDNKTVCPPRKRRVFLHKYTRYYKIEV